MRGGGGGDCLAWLKTKKNQCNEEDGMGGEEVEQGEDRSSARS